MFNKKNNKEEVIRMEQTTFLQRHYKKVLLAGGVVATGIIGGLLYKYKIDIDAHDLRIFNLEDEVKNIKIKLGTNTDIAIKALKDKIQEYEFEIEQLIFKRDNLNDTQQNVFINIPKLNEEIELKTTLKNKTIDILERAIETGKTE